MHRTCSLIGLFSAAALLFSGCASNSAVTSDVSTPTHLEIVEFDGVVDTPVDLAYTNILGQAQHCWRTKYSGEIEATAASMQDPAQIRFVVPGKIVGSRVPLTTVRLFPLSENQTRVVGVSSILPGKWHLSSLEGWAEATLSECSSVQRI